MRTTLRQKIKKLRGQLKHSDTLFALRRFFVDKDLRRERKLMRLTTVKNKSQIKSEIKAYKKYWGCRPDDYIRYGLHSRKLDMQAMLDYVPMHYYYCDFYDMVFEPSNTLMSDDNFIRQNYPATAKSLATMSQPVLKSIKYGKDLSDKLLQYLMMSEKGILVPEVVGYICNGTIYDIENNKASFSLIKDLAKKTDKIFVKPTDGCGGEDIVVLKCSDNKLYFGELEVTDLHRLKLNPSRTYIVQHAIKQASQLQAINGTSVNTLRVIVKYEEGKPQIIGVILRIGRLGSDVDNSHMGGISIAVDAETGMFADYAGREHGGGKFYEHPDNGYKFKGNGIDNWPEVRKQILQTVGTVNQANLLGWDIVLTDNGVYAIEFNLGFGIEHAQIMLGGMRRRLGIDKIKSHT